MPIQLENVTVNKNLRSNYSDLKLCLTLGNKLNIEQAIRSLKKKMQREGLYKEMKLRKHYEKPCLKRAREKEENIRRARKSAKRNND